VLTSIVLIVVAMALALNRSMVWRERKELMQSPPELFDADLLALRRARAAGAGATADFIHRAVAREVAERLTEINRPFRDVAITGPQNDIWSEELAAAAISAPRLTPDRDVLDLALGAFDLVIHGLALHWANDPVGQLVQARRALRPDGLFIGALFGGETLHELRASLALAETEVLGGLSPRVAPMGELRELGGLLQRAGLALPVADALRYDVSYETPLALMRDLRAMGESNVMRERSRRPMRHGMLDRACEIYAQRHSLPDGRIAATFEVLVLTGWAPAPSQPKALRPGSAQARLADVLGAVERGPEEETRG
jgi:SAM-dependent methyltransferase